jgi:elongation factor Ts
MVSIEQVKELRDSTGISIMQCKKALEEANGDKAKALLLLKQKSSDIASKKEGRNLGSGIIATYIHGAGSVGAMVELDCETDFVAKNEEFVALARDIAMHVAALNPEFLKLEDIDDAAKEKMTKFFTEEVEKSDKPEEIKAKMLQGKIDTYFKESTLLEQPFVKNGDVTIGQLVKEAIQKFGEKTELVRFSRFAVGK